MPGSVLGPSSERDTNSLTRRVERLERRRRDIGTPAPRNCECPDNEGFCSSSDTGVAGSGTFQQPTWTASNVGTGIFANTGDIETTEGGLYAINGFVAFDAGTTTLDTVEVQIRENSLASVLCHDARPGVAVSMDGVGQPKVTRVSLGGVFSLPPDANVDLQLRARSVSFNYTATLWVLQVNRFPAV